MNYCTPDRQFQFSFLDVQLLKVEVDHLSSCCREIGACRLFVMEPVISHLERSTDFDDR